MRLVRGLLKLLVTLAVLAGLAYVIVFVIGAQYTFDDVRRGSPQVGPKLSGTANARTFKIGLSLANRGDRDVQIKGVGGIEGNALSRVRTRMAPADEKARRRGGTPARKLKKFKAFDLKPGRQRAVVLVASFRCSELGDGERITIDALEVEYKVGFFDKDKDIALDRRVRIGRKRARC
ncbi:MAG: hypothetical protein WKF32_01050 [Thermoleophilaceae bacterium]